MNSKRIGSRALASGLLLVLCALGSACEKSGNMNGMFDIMEGVSVASGITYKQIDSIDLALDVYFPAHKVGQEPWDVLPNDLAPTIIYFHGGGWIEGDRASRLLGLLPYLANGWCVVNVEYRLLEKTHLIGSLNDCIDAINWVHEHAANYAIDPDRIYLSGESAGGHLALLAGMAEAQPIGNTRIHEKNCSIRGVINWYGISEMESAMAFWNDDEYAATIIDKWPGDQAAYLAATSPVTHISANTPPILSIHGDADVNVEIAQSISLHERLDAAGIRNQLIVIPDKKHGNFSADEYAKAFEQIWRFVEKPGANY